MLRIAEFALGDGPVVLMAAGLRSDNGRMTTGRGPGWATIPLGPVADPDRHARAAAGPPRHLRDPKETDAARRR